MVTRFTGRFGFGYNQSKISPLVITQKVLKITGKPIFNPVFGFLGMRLKIVCKHCNQLFLHTGTWVRNTPRPGFGKDYSVRDGSG